MFTFHRGAGVTVTQSSNGQQTNFFGVSLRSTTDKKNVRIRINGRDIPIPVDVQTMLIETEGEVNMEVMLTAEHVDKVQAAASDVHINGDVTPASATSGTIDCNDVLGNAACTSGSIKCRDIKGSASATSGSVRALGQIKHVKEKKRPVTIEHARNNIIMGAIVAPPSSSSSSNPHVDTPRDYLDAAFARARIGK